MQVKVMSGQLIHTGSYNCPIHRDSLTQGQVVTMPIWLSNHDTVRDSQVQRRVRVVCEPEVDANGIDAVIVQIAGMP